VTMALMLFALQPDAAHRGHCNVEGHPGKLAVEDTGEVGGFVLLLQWLRASVRWLTEKTIPFVIGTNKPM
jgi:hypothetical protein